MALTFPGTFEAAQASDIVLSNARKPGREYSLTDATLGRLWNLRGWLAGNRPAKSACK